MVWHDGMMKIGVHDPHATSNQWEHAIRQSDAKFLGKSLAVSHSKGGPGGFVG